MLPTLPDCLLFPFACLGKSLSSSFLVCLFVLQLSHWSPPSQLCTGFVCLFLHRSEVLLNGISCYQSVMRRTGSVTLKFPEVYIVMLSFHFLFMRKPTLSVVCLRVVQKVATRQSVETFLFSSDLFGNYQIPMMFPFSSFPVLVRALILVIFLLCCDLQSLHLTCGDASWPSDS